MSNQIIKRLLNDKVVAVVPNMFGFFIQLAKIGFNFLLVNGLFHALWDSNLQVLLLFLVLQYLVGDVRVQHDTCGKLELGMQFTQ